MGRKGEREITEERGREGGRIRGDDVVFVEMRDLRVMWGGLRYERREVDDDGGALLNTPVVQSFVHFASRLVAPTNWLPPEQVEENKGSKPHSTHHAVSCFMLVGEKRFQSQILSE